MSADRDRAVRRQKQKRAKDQKRAERRLRQGPPASDAGASSAADRNTASAAA
jgi:hypothetical protein